MTQPQKSIDPIKTFILVLILLGIGVFFLNSVINLYKIGVDADQYKKATFCQYENGCRRTIEAEILDSRTISIDRRYSSNRFDFDSYPKIVSYYIDVKFAYRETYTIELLPNLNINVKDFMLDNVYLPVRQSGMAEASFIKGHMVKIEMWKNKPSMIYSRSVLGAPPLSGKDEYAIPTDDNPLVYDALERDNFVKTSTGLVFAFLWLILLFSL